MQAVLCLILLVSVGLAGLVTHERRVNRYTHLAGVRYVESIGVRLPAGWILERADRGQVLFVAHEPDLADRKGRRIIVEKHQVEPGQSAVDFLQNSGLLSGTERLTSGDSDESVIEPLTVADMPGVMLAVKRPIGGFLFFRPTGYEIEFFAASVRPSGLAISLRLDCPLDSDPQDDQQTLRDIAGAMEVQDAKPGS